MTCIKDIAKFFESVAPLGFQESYDNTGLIVGNEQASVDTVLVTLDVTEKVVDEAIEKKAQLIVAHHPLIFSGLKKITGKNEVERSLIKAIKNDIAIYAAHTNLDSVTGGVNTRICEKLNLKNCRVLRPLSGQLKKLVTFIPEKHLQQVSEAVFEAGAGHIGNYDYCGYTVNGTGSFRGNENTNPFVGQKGEIHYEKETRFETIFPAHLQGKILSALLAAHPYEEVAYDIYPLDNRLPNAGMGMVGELESPLKETEFLESLKRTFRTGAIRHTRLLGNQVSKVAVCGGAGSFLLPDALAAGAQFFVSGDFKYHQFFDAEDRIVIADIGHFESEQFTKALFYELLIKNFPTFAVHLSEVNTNPVSYF